MSREPVIVNAPVPPPIRVLKQRLMGSRIPLAARALEESTQSFLNRRASASSITQKPVAGNGAAHDANLQAKEAHNIIYAHVVPARPDTSPKELVPIATLARSKLPLAWINTSGKKASLPPGRLLQPIKSIDWEQDAPLQTVIAVRLTPQNEIYVLEDASCDTCVACALWDWVTEEQVKSLSKDRSHNQACLPPIKNGLHSPTTTEAPFATEGPRKPRNKKGILARKALIPDKENSQKPHLQANGLSSETSTSVFNVGALNSENNHPSPRTIETQSNSLDSHSALHIPFPKSLGDPSTTQQSPWPEFDPERLVTQYLETLYLSIASIAFFAKGPLARARNTQLQNNGYDQEEAPLSQFLKNHILPEKKLDNKHKETIPGVIRDTAMNEDDNGKDSRNLVRRSRKKAGKPGRDGLLCTEPDFIRKWWKGRHEDDGATKGVDSKALLRELRNRETQLQILYILEALILEQPSPRVDVKREQEMPSLESIPTKSPRKTKKIDLNAILEALLDRLCIWHTVGDDIEAIIGDQPTINTTKQPSNDKLREFCIEVIVPFYGAKLPVQCKMISRKLGGPTDASPVRPRPPLTKSASISVLRPGSAVQVRRRPTQQLSLQRVLSDERDVQRSRSPSIGRPSTMSSVPALKREPSETDSRPASRGSISKNIRFENREVDLEAVAKQQHSKLKRINSLVEQKKELDAAINALRKPNRTLQARDFIDSVEKRTSLIPHKGPRKRLAKDDLSTSKPGIQVTATPKKRKPFQSQPAPSLRFTTTARSPSPDDLHPRETDEPAIPSSSLRSTTVTTSSQPHPSSSSLQIISATPSTTRIRPPDHFLHTIQNTPLRMTKSQRPVQMTPLKKANVPMDDIFRTAPVLEKPPGREVSIYESLGWEDGDGDGDGDGEGVELGM